MPGRKTEALNREEKSLVKNAKNVGIIGIHLYNSRKMGYSIACLITKEKYDFINEKIGENMNKWKFDYLALTNS